VKLFCSTCKSREAFRPFCLKDGTIQRNFNFSNQVGKRSIPIALQTFVLPYQCQVCLSVPDFFLVTRRQLKLQLAGRDPIEYVEVSAAFPAELSLTVLFWSPEAARSDWTILWQVSLLGVASTRIEERRR
jgi:hypothetical protein